MCLSVVGIVMLGVVTNSTEVADNPWLMNFLIDCGKFVLAAIGGGVIAMRYAEKIGIAAGRVKGELFGSTPNRKRKTTPAEGVSQERMDLETQRLRAELKDARSKIQHADSQMAMLRSQNQQLKIDRETFEHKLEEARRIEISFPTLIKLIQDQLSKNTDDKERIMAFLAQQGLHATFEFKDVPEGFIMVKNEEASTPYAYSPAIIRGDDVVLTGIVHVPLTFAGAEPPKPIGVNRHSNAVPVENDKVAEKGETGELSVLDANDDFLMV